jgi:hypothetical protein
MRISKDGLIMSNRFLIKDAQEDIQGARLKV